jgi:hypothetical protein
MAWNYKKLLFCLFRKERIQGIILLFVSVQIQKTSKPIISDLSQ